MKKMWDQNNFKSTTAFFIEISMIKSKKRPQRYRNNTVTLAFKSGN